jgi:plasmid stabilization system protein ParE
MKPFVVEWWRPARDDLTRLWANGSDREAITDAANRLDRRLAADPLSLLRPGHEGLMKASIHPLVVQVTIDERKRKVKVWSVRRII